MAINHFKKYQVAFIHGRPKGHPIHALYAEQLGATFIYEDFILRWHDRPNSLKIKRYLNKTAQNVKNSYAYLTAFNLDNYFDILKY